MQNNISKIELHFLNKSVYRINYSEVKLLQIYKMQKITISQYVGSEFEDYYYYANDISIILKKNTCKYKDQKTDRTLDENLSYNNPINFIRLFSDKPYDINVPWIIEKNKNICQVVNDINSGILIKISEDTKRYKSHNCLLSNF